ncbi:tRNA-dihydrouridine synthase A [Nematocida sp. AWRm80]|nr:tRNA-dihydrouridine synthase A [Nematocida sp. AWRm80]
MVFEVHVAPMIGVSTPEYRRFMRLLSPNSFVFTEMIVDTSLIHMPSEVLERKIGLPTDKCIIQVGGSVPEQIAKGVKRAAYLGYKLFNLNCGCPSDRVQSGAFGAILMKSPRLIAEIVQEVYKQTGIIMSIKCRTGVDDIEDYNSFISMIDTICAYSPCRTFFIHARKCLLKGLSPADNRRVPPLTHEYVYQLKKDRPDLTIILNGVITEKDQILKAKESLDGVMLARKAMNDPFFFTEIEQILFSTPLTPITETVQKYLLEQSNHTLEQQRFISLDQEYISSLAPENQKKITQTKQPNQIEIPSETDSSKEVTKETNPLSLTSLATYSVLKPIEPLLFGKKGCKEYKRQISELSRNKVPFSTVYQSIQPYLLSLL